ncbi:MAG: SemiSWEET family transporter [Dehalococcoidales bacterium]|nr:SemiSWEET family transporter [Dehalococcoidales bacterium]
MDWKELLGFIGGVLTTGSLIPQIARFVKLKSAQEMSLTFTICFIAGIGFWLAYGIVQGLTSVIVWNSISMVVGFSMLYAKLKYGR